MSVFAGITKVNEGYGVSERDIPIEIQDNKLLEWLISRKKSPTHWKATSLKLQQEIKTVVASLPPDIVYPKNRDLNYFDIEDIMTQLVSKSKESTDKTLFGKYTSEKMRSWDNIKTAYEKNSVYLAESASLFVNSLKYEVPNIKKNIDNQQKQTQELSRKTNEHLRNANDFKLQYQKACKEMNIKGDDLRAELENLINDLPGLFDDICELVKQPTFQSAIQFYKKWVSSLGNAVPNAKGEIDLQLDVLEYLCEHGNESVAKMEKRKNPDYQSDENEDNDNQRISVETSGIDWGAITEVIPSTSTPASIPVPLDTPAVDWNADSTSAINWDITIENEGDVDPTASILNAQKTTTVHHSETILENASSRKQFLFSLIELSAFFTQRLDHFNSDTSTSININEMSGAPSFILQNDNLESVGRYSEAVDAILTKMEDKHLQNLIDMKNSKSVIERLALSIQLKLDRKTVAERTASDCRMRCEEIESEIQHNLAKLESSKQYIRQIKNKLQVEISKLYDGRVVRIFGEVDKL